MGDTKQRDQTIAFLGPFCVLRALRSRLREHFSRQTLDILLWRKQEERKPRNQDFKAAPTRRVELRSFTWACILEGGYKLF